MDKIKKRALPPVPERKPTSVLPGPKKVCGLTATITTINAEGAGTDADVYLAINAHKFLLDKPHYDDFEAGDTDSYGFTLNMTLDDLRRSTIELGHNNKGKQPGWLCGRVSLYVRFQGSCYNRLYKEWSEVGWLAKDENQGELVVVLQTGEELAA